MGDASLRLLISPSSASHALRRQKTIRLKFMSQLPPSPNNWPYCDSSAPNSISGEKDACGVGFLAQIQGTQSHWVLEQALRGLSCMEHRGGCGGDSNSGDGAGILCEIPWNYLKSGWADATTLSSPTGLGMLLMPNEPELRVQTKQFCEQEAEALGLNSKGWRIVPVDSSVLGPLALQTAPFIEQWLVEGATDGNGLEAELFRLRRRIGERARNVLGVNSNKLYIAS